MKYNIRYLIAKSLKTIGLPFDATKSPEVQAMRHALAELGSAGIQFTVSQEPNGEWMAESVNVPGIITGGTASDNIDAMIKDAIFTYYAIPPEYCDDAIFHHSGEPTPINQRMHLSPAKA